MFHSTGPRRGNFNMLHSVWLKLWLTNIRLAWKTYTGINTLAYFEPLPTMRKKVFFNIATRCQCYKTFCLHHWWWGLISQRVCPWKPFPVRSLNLRARPEPTKFEHLSDTSFLGKLLVLPANVRLDWKVIARYKHSSLFEESKKVF